MGIGVSLLDTVGFLLVASVLFLPVVWFVMYVLWEIAHIRSRAKVSYHLVSETPVRKTEREEFEKQRAA